MYRTTRNLHLLASVFTLAFLLVYALSSVAMSHNTWVNARPRSIDRQAQLPPGLSLRAAAIELLRRGEVAGEIREIQPERVTIASLGVQQLVGYDPETGAARIRENRFGVWGLLNRIHHLSGFWHEDRLLNWWSAFLLATSLGLILMGATGIYLWYRTKGTLVPGAITLAISLFGGGALLALVRL